MKIKYLNTFVNSVDAKCHLDKSRETQVACDTAPLAREEQSLHNLLCHLDFHLFCASLKSKTNLNQEPKSLWAKFKLLTCLLDNRAGKLTITPTKRTWWGAEPLSSCRPSHITVGLQKVFLMAFSDLSVQNWIFHNTPDSPRFTVHYVLNGFLVTPQVHYGRRGNLISSLPQDTNTEQGRNTNDRAQFKNQYDLNYSSALFSIVFNICWDTTTS